MYWALVGGGLAAGAASSGPAACGTCPGCVVGSGAVNRWLRLFIGVVVVGVLFYLWLHGPMGLWVAVARLVAIGLIGGLVMRSWWAVVVVPALLSAGPGLVAAIIAGGDAASSEDTPGALFMLQLIYVGVPTALGAAGGVVIATRVVPAFRMWRH